MPDLGSTGVAYVWYVSPGIDRGQVWAGRADLAVGPQWQYVDAAAATYKWTLYDVDRGAAVKPGGSATIAGFTAVLIARGRRLGRGVPDEDKPWT